MTRPVVRLGRRQAAALIEEIASIMVRGRKLDAAAEGRVKAALANAGIAFTPCHSPCHENEAQIDNCLTCAPHWGVVGPEVKVR